VRLEQPYQALEKLVTAAVLINGKETRLLQDVQATEKLVPPVASSVASNDLRAEQP
jgi:hypothetical protein